MILIVLKYFELLIKYFYSLILKLITTNYFLVKIKFLKNIKIIII